MIYDCQLLLLERDNQLFEQKKISIGLPPEEVENPISFFQSFDCNKIVINEGVTNWF